MRKKYRGCDIESYGERSMGGWREVYWSAFTQQGFEITSGFGGGTVREMFVEMKRNVDWFLDDFGGDKERWSER